MEPTFIPLPKKPIVKGDEWRQPFKVAVEGLGHLAIEKTYTAAGEDTLAGKPLHKIAVHAEVKLLRDAGEGMPITYSKAELVDQETKGTYWFDAKAGRLLKAEGFGRCQIRFEALLYGRNVEGDITTTSTYEVSLCDHNPLHKQAEEARQAAVAVKAEKPWTNTIGMQLARVQPGKFVMGSDEEDADHRPDETQHEVEISKAFHMGVHEVTVGQFRKFVEDAKYQTDAERYAVIGFGFDKQSGKVIGDKRFSWRDPGFEQTDDHPVVNVTWKDAVAFCEWLSKKEGKTYRLPTEAEWEYACRAGTQTRYYNGDDGEKLGAVANILDASAKNILTAYNKYAANDGYIFTAPVGQFKPNAFGLYDMHGNGNEWCADYYAPYNKSDKKDPKGPEKGMLRVCRGGTFLITPVPVARRRGCGFRSTTTIAAWVSGWC